MSRKYNFEKRSESGYVSVGESDLSLPLQPFDDSSIGVDNESIFIQRHCSPSSSFMHSESMFDGKGILFDRIKEAHDTIEDLSSKLFQCENDIVILNERKKTFEQGYFNLEKENELLRADKITRDDLLQKVNLMSEQVTELLKTQENLADKHHKQQNSLALLKVENKLLNEENNRLKEINTSFTNKSKQDSITLEKCKSSESKLMNKFMIVQIEKEAFSSEYDRIIDIFHIEEDKCATLENKLYLLEDGIKSSNQKQTLLNDKLTSFEERNELLQSELKRVLKDCLHSENKLKDNISNLILEKETLLSEKRDIQKNLSSFQKSCFRLENKMKEVMIENCACKNKFDELHKIHGELNLQNEDLNDKFEILLTKSNKLEREKESLSKKLRISQDETANADKRFEKLKSKSKSKMKELDTEINEMKKNTINMEDNYEKEISRINRNFDLQVQELSKAKQIAEETTYRLQHEVDSLRERCQALEINTASLNTSLGEKHLSHQNELDVLINDKSSLQKESSNLNLLVDQYEQRVTGYDADLQELKEKYAESVMENKSKSTLVKSLQETVQSLTKENTDLKKECKENLHLINVINEQSKNELEHEKHSSILTLRKLEVKLQHCEEILKLSQNETETIKKTNQENILMLVEKHKNEIYNLTENKSNIEKKYNLANTELLQVQKEFDKMSTLYANQQVLMKRLTNELEDSKIDLKKLSVLQQERKQHEETIEDWSKQVELLQKENEKLVEEKKENSLHTTELLERLNISIQDTDKQRTKVKNEKQKYLAREQKLKKDLYELSSKNERLKVELRQKSLTKPSIQEMEMLTTDFDNVKKELLVLAELNKKLEEVNKTSHDENDVLRKNNEHQQVDIAMLKSSFEGLLTKELEKQRSEHLIRENELLKKLSNISIS